MAAEGLTLPNFETLDGAYPSFLTNRDGELLEPYPHDELSGLPLCYTPHFDLPAPSTKPVFGNRIADWEHLVPRVEVVRSVGNPMLATEIGKAALVNARIQWVSFNEHHLKKNNIYRGPAHPTTQKSMINFLMMAEAGYIPADAMDFSGETPIMRTLSWQERNFLRDSGHVRPACEGFVRKYLLETIKAQDVDWVYEEKRDEFLKTFDMGRKLYLAHMLAAKLVEQIVEPVAEPYRQASKDGLLDPRLPSSPAEFIKKTILRAARDQAVNEMSYVFGKEKRRKYPELYTEPCIAA